MNIVFIVHIFYLLNFSTLNHQGRHLSRCMIIIDVNFTRENIRSLFQNFHMCVCFCNTFDWMWGKHMWYLYCMFKVKKIAQRKTRNIYGNWKIVVIIVSVVVDCFAYKEHLLRWIEKGWTKIRLLTSWNFFFYDSWDQFFSNKHQLPSKSV